MRVGFDVIYKDREVDAIKRLHKQNVPTLEVSNPLFSTLQITVSMVIVSTEAG